MKIAVAVVNTCARWAFGPLVIGIHVTTVRIMV